MTVLHYSVVDMNAFDMNSDCAGACRNQDNCRKEMCNVPVKVMAMAMVMEKSIVLVSVDQLRVGLFLGPIYLFPMYSERN